MAFALLATVGLKAFASTLMPMPASIKRGEGYWVSTERIPVVISGIDSLRLQRALVRWQRNLALEHDVMLPLDFTSPVNQSGLTVFVGSPGADYPSIDSDETYQLTVGSTGIVLRAASIYGALHGLETLRQLAHRCGDQLCFAIVNIDDYPRYAWRGLLIDVVRHWIPPDVIKRQLDGMAAVKLNVLHWHLTDDQGFRVESKVYPRLHTVGSDGDFYTQAEIRDIVEYAADRGIRVMPEFDLPGHSRSWQIAYSFLASRPDAEYKLYAANGIFSDPIDPTREETYRFLEALTEEMAALFPDAYFHLGGDEVNTSAWEDSDSINEFIDENGIADYAGLQAFFVQRYAEIIRQRGKIPVGWNEILHPDLPSEVMVHAWNTTDFSPLVKRHPILVSTNYYLDHVRSAEFHYRSDPSMLTLEGAVDADLPENVIGVEAASWGEVRDALNIDTCIWPRTAAIAERFWSPAHFTDNADMTDVYYRMEQQSKRLARAGFTHYSYQDSELKSLAATGNAQALAILADVIEPQKIYLLFSMGYMSRLLLPGIFGEIADEPYELPPFTRSLAYESLSAWHFNHNVQRYIDGQADEAMQQSLIAQLKVWAGNHAALKETIENSPALKTREINLLSSAVSELATVGLAVMESRSTGGLSTGELKDYLAVVERYQPLPASFDRELLEAVFWRILEPEVMLQHTIAIQPGIAALLAAAHDGE